MKGIMIDDSAMNETATNIGGWQESYMRNTTMDTIFDNLPTALQNIIKPVNKISTVGNASTNTVTTEDKLWLFSRVELDGITDSGYCDEGTQYEYWAEHNDNTGRVKRRPDGLTQTGGWRLRSASVTNATTFICVNPNGSFNTGAVATETTAFGVSFGFCI
jgi:hypothetical protein